MFPLSSLAFHVFSSDFQGTEGRDDGAGGQSLVFELLHESGFRCTRWLSTACSAALPNIRQHEDVSTQFCPIKM